MQHLLAVDVTDAIDMGIGQGVAEPCLIGKKKKQSTNRSRFYYANNPTIGRPTGQKEGTPNGMC